jgi:diguanylate cyclase (GGDEF)-like protein
MLGRIAAELTYLQRFPTNSALIDHIRNQVNNVNENIARRLQFCSTLPSLPAVAIKMIELAKDPDASMVEIGAHVSLDPALSAKLLKVANSPLYQTRRTPTNVRQAVSLMGTHAAIMIGLSFSLTSSFKEQRDNTNVDTALFWRRSILSALACRALGEKLGMDALDDLFLAGLLQDIGVLAFDAMMPEQYRPVFTSASDHDALLQAEHKEFDCGHDEVGHWLLKRWNLPDYLAQACLASHNPPAAETMTPAVACVIVSGYIADSLLEPNNAAATSRAEEQAQTWLSLNPQALAVVLETIRNGLHTVEELFDITLLSDSEMTAIMAEAKELLVIHELKKMHELEEKSQRDALTGAHNRGYFDDALRREFDHATRHHWPVSIALIDLDHFKHVNDTYGHPRGDSVLISVVRAILGHIRQDDVLARYGGEEFAIILPSTPLEPATTLLVRLKECIAALRHVHDDGEHISVTTSIGVASHMDGSCYFETPEAMIKAADQALYAAKKAGRDRVIVWAGSPA